MSTNANIILNSQLLRVATAAYYKHGSVDAKSVKEVLMSGEVTRPDVKNCSVQRMAAMVISQYHMVNCN